MGGGNDSVGGFGALPRREHPLARVLYCDHRYHTTETRPRLVLVGVWRRLQRKGERERKREREREGPRGENRWNDPAVSCELAAGRA